MCKNFLLILALTTANTTGLADNSDDRLHSNLLSFAFDRFDPPIFQKAIVDNVKIDIIKRFGYPLFIETSIKPDRSNPGYDEEIEEWKYNELMITIKTDIIPNPGSSLTSITLTSSAYELQLGLNIGSDKLEYRKYLGNPQKLETNTYTYRAGHFTTIDGVAFHFSQDIIIEFDDQNKSTSITWTYPGH